jgi:uncharacterized protein
MLRVVLDTNISVAILLSSRNCCDIRDAFLDGFFDWLISEELLAELLLTLRKPRLAHLFKPEDIREMLGLLQTDAEWVTLRSRIVASRDPDDDVVLGCAVDGQADAIVTGDKDLLSLKSFRKIPILTPRQFLDILQKRR